MTSDRTPRPTTVVLPGGLLGVAHARVGRWLPFEHPQRSYILAATLPGFVALVLPWRLGANGVWTHGVQGPGWITFLLSSIIAGALLLGDLPRPLSRAEKNGVLALSNLALLLSLWKLFSAPAGAIALGVGAPLALVSAALVQLVTWPMKAVDGDPRRSAWARVRRGLEELSGRRSRERAEKRARRDILLKLAGEAALSPKEGEPEPLTRAREAVDAPGKPVPGKRERAILRLGRAAVDAGIADSKLIEDVRTLDQQLTN
jgi:hypothetical protein